MTSERKFVTENVRRMLLKEYIKKETKRAGFGGLDIQRTPMGTRVTMLIERPGLVIGRKGSAIKRLTEAVDKEFNFDNPQIEVQEVENASLNAQVMAEKLSSALERGWHFRRAGHSTVRRIMEAGAKGCLVVLSGKLTGQRHRTEKFKQGHIKFCGEPALEWMEVGFSEAKKKLGAIGVKVMIMDPKAKLPDEIEIFAPKPPEEEEAPEDAAKPDAEDSKDAKKKKDTGKKAKKADAKKPKADKPKADAKKPKADKPKADAKKPKAGEPKADDKKQKADEPKADNAPKRSAEEKAEEKAADKPAETGAKKDATAAAPKPEQAPPVPAAAEGEEKTGDN